MNNGTEQIFIINSNENQPTSTTQRLMEIPEPPQVNLENVQDFSNVCRTCATVTEFVIPIFEGEGLQNNLADKIRKHLPIRVSQQDVLPRVVCYQCASTLLAWHELVACCVQADAALRSRLPLVPTVPPAEQDRKPTVSTPSQTVSNINNLTNITPHRWNGCQMNAIKTENCQENASNDSDDDHSVDDDDEPLSTLVHKKADLYNNFYKALVNFKNHFASKHKTFETYPEFTESSDSEALEDNEEDTDMNGESIENYDDLTQSNMRKDRMDEETRLELIQVQRKVNGKVYYTCRICDKNLSSTHTYLFHQRIHTGERPCVCHVCGKQFRAPAGLQRHLRETHERLRRHACALCHNKFANSQNLKQHMRIHTGERPYACAHCGKRFTQSGSLHVHLKTHSALLPHRCPECGAKFRLRAGLQRHRLKHSGERPHACAHCSKAFRHKHELNNHLAAHSDAKPHACALCGLAFKQRRALRYHTKRVHDADLAHIHQLVYNQASHY